MGPVAVLLALLAGAPVCPQDPHPDEVRGLLLAINLARTTAGRPPLAGHPVLCGLARWRAAAVSASGRSAPDMSVLQHATHGFYREGYPPHAWAESTLIADPCFPLLLQWQDVKPDWLPELATGDYEHIALATGDFGALRVVSGFVALPQCRVEERRALPLRDLAAARSAALAAVNEVRAERGLGPVAADERLDAAAQAHAEDMQRRGYYSHDSPEGSTPAGRAYRAGLRRNDTVGENIAKGLFTPDETVRRWMNSRGHRRNILRPEVELAGLGVAIGASGRPGDCIEVIWVQLLSGR